MPEELASAILAELLAVLAHPDRILAIEELRHGEMDVNTLCARVGTAHAKMSQHLGKLRSLRLVNARRDGRHIYYSLANLALAGWLRDGLGVALTELAATEEMRSALDETLVAWKEE